MNNYTSTSLGIRIWFFSSVAIALGFAVFYLYKGNFEDVIFSLLVLIVALVLSTPVIVAFAIFLPILKKLSFIKNKIVFTHCLAFAIALVYGSVAAIFDTPFYCDKIGSSILQLLQSIAYFTAIVFACGGVAILFSLKNLQQYFLQQPICNINESWQADNQTQINNFMETTNHPTASWNKESSSHKSSNKIITKAAIIAVLTLCMMIPTTIISNLIIERQTTYNSQIKDGVKEVTAQTTINTQNYEQTMRTTKYAILVIALTFAVFFLIELMHKKPVHPIQYTLVGLALAIFYTLLLSISEYLLFNYAYTISAVATITLITLYVKSHFNNWKAASALSGVLTALYGFILVLVSLEHTALLFGSIGLFIVLAVVMYVTRNINWYNLEFTNQKPIEV